MSYIINKCHNIFKITYPQAVLLDYQGVNRSESTFMMSLLYGIALTFQFTEVGCYIIFYNHLYTHDKLMLNNAVISRDTYKNRQRTNIFSMGGQICCFITELLFMVNGIIWINLGDNYSISSMKEIYFVFKIYEFGFLSTVQVLTSKDLSILFKKVLKIKSE